MSFKLCGYTIAESRRYALPSAMKDRGGEVPGRKCFSELFPQDVTIYVCSHTEVRDTEGPESGSNTSGSERGQILCQQ